MSEIEGLEMGFETIVGHQKQKHYFQKVLENGSLSHAYCFVGLEGIGKGLLARSAARLALCGDQSSHYIKFDSGNHPDYLEIRPDGATIKTEQVEEIHHFMHIKPFLSARKIVLIDDAHLMTEVAQNKLLKLLEDPPGHSAFFLVVNNELKLLETVRSRMIRMRFFPLHAQEMAIAILKMNYPMDQSVLEASLGSLKRYILWMDDASYKQSLVATLKGLKALCEGKSGQWLQTLSVLEAFKDNGEDLLDFIFAWFQDLALVKADVDQSYLRLPHEWENMIQCIKYLSQQQVEACKTLVLEAQGALKRQQNYNLVIESLFFNIQEAIHGKGNRR